MARRLSEFLRTLNPQDIQNHANTLWDQVSSIGSMGMFYNLLDLLPGTRETATLLADISPEDRLYLQNEANLELRAFERRCQIKLNLSSNLTQVVQSRQISISGPPEEVRDVYLEIRKLIPITVWFDLKLNPALPSMLLDPSSGSLQEIQKKYEIAICMVPIQSPVVQPTPANHICIYIRTKRRNEANLKNAIEDLTVFIESNNYGHIYPTLQTKIEVPNNQHNIIGSHRTYSILDPIASKTSTQISVQKSASNIMSNVSITGGSYTSISSARNEISDRFVVELDFDVRLEENVLAIFLENLGRHLERLGEETGTHILMKPHPNQPNQRTMIIRGSDKEVEKIFEVRKQIFNWILNPPIIAGPSVPNAAFVH